MSSRHKIFFSPSARKKETHDKFNEKYTIIPYLRYLKSTFSQQLAKGPSSLSMPQKTCDPESFQDNDHSRSISSERTEWRSPDRLVWIEIIQLLRVVTKFRKSL